MLEATISRSEILARCRTPQDFFAMQAELARENLNTALRVGPAACQKFRDALRKPPTKYPTVSGRLLDASQLKRPQSTAASSPLKGHRDAVESANGRSRRLAREHGWACGPSRVCAGALRGFLASSLSPPLANVARSLAVAHRDRRAGTQFRCLEAQSASPALRCTCRLLTRRSFSSGAAISSLLG
jgi:hypothetical protein